MSNTPVLSRRGFLGATLAGAGLSASLSLPTSAHAQTLLADLRGSLDVTNYGVRPGALDNQSSAFQQAINRAAADGQPLFVPAGDYLVSNLDLPSGLTLIGVPGRSRIVYAGDGHLMFATGVTHVRLEGLVLDGGNRRLADYTPALLHVSTGADIGVDDCTILGSTKDGVVFDRVSGRLENTTISGARGAAFQSNDAQGLAIRDNVIQDCGDNGILVFRWEEGRDGTVITGNRVERIRSLSGGTGQNGNGINVFRAHDVMVANNIIDDCDFSALRANAASNVQMVANHCTRSGEVAVFSEFGFQGAIIANNVIDDAASGIGVANFLDDGRMAVVQGNLVRNMRMQSRINTGEPSFGIGISVEADTTVSNNVIESAAMAGINVGWGPYMRNIIVSQNIIRRAPVGVQVSVVDGVGQSLITGNMMDETPDGAIIGMRWWDRATQDLLGSNPRDLPPGLTLEGNHATS